MPAPDAAAPDPDAAGPETDAAGPEDDAAPPLPDAAVVFVLVRSAGLDSLRCHVIPLPGGVPAARAAAPAQ